MFDKKENEIIEEFNQSLPHLSEKMNDQEKLDHYFLMLESQGKNWLKNIQTFNDDKKRIFNNKQEQIFIGSMLGDGCITKNYQNNSACKFTLTQSTMDHKGIDKRSYLEWFGKEFDDFNANISESTRKPSGLVKECGTKEEYYSYTLTTKTLNFWKKLEKQWYVPRTDHHFFKRRKIVPDNIKLTPLTLCVWHMEDGSNNQIDGNVELNTQGFSIEEIDFLINRLKEDLGIQSKPKKSNEQFKIYIGIKSYSDFIEMIKPHVEWDCFKYKVDTSGYDKVAQIGEDHSQAKLKNKDIDKMFKLREKGWMQKDIAKKFKVSKTMVSRTLSGDMHKHSGKKLETTRKPRVTKDQKLEIITLNEQGMFQKEIAGRLNINQSTVSRIIRRSQCQG